MEAQTNFTKRELQVLYRGFKNECPSGVVNEDTFKQIYAQFFPQGDASMYAHYLFNAFDSAHNGSVKFENLTFVGLFNHFPQGDASMYAHYLFNAFDSGHNGSVKFEDFVMALSILLRGSVREKLSWTFNLYDINKDGYINKEEMTDIIRAIYDMMGKYTYPVLRRDAQRQHVDAFFQKMDKNKDGVVTLDEFIMSCQEDENIMRSLQLFECVIECPEQQCRKQGFTPTLLKKMLVSLLTCVPLILFLMHSTCVLSGAKYPDRNDSDLSPTIQKLMKGYNRYLRPKFNEGPIEIGMSLDIASIDAISEINMDYTATIFLRQRWTDERLLFEANKSLSLDGRLVELLWVPDTFIVDSKKSFLHDITVENRLIRIFSNGTVLYALRITATIACNMDLTKYPMDRQVCTLQLESWGYNLQDVVFYWTRGNDSVKGLDTLQLAQYSVESYYTSVSQAVYETGFYPKLVLHFALRRNILYFILETYVPSTLLVALSWVSFWISQSSVPARTCIGVTTVLTMTTLMMGARTSLPNANCFIKAIDVYLGICFSFIFGALLEYAIAHFCTVQHFTLQDVQPLIY
ncbi:UNVERIFIED_CONTAM: hypothetical protein FKN15_017084 [Acipenser sinensis]